MSRASCILAVDDEPSLLAMFERYLSRVGYKVDPCGTAVEALGLFCENPAKYGLVLVDATMPGMSGEELASELLRVNPEVSVLICSGYPFDPLGLAESVRQRVRFLQKPFLPKTLLDMIEELLGPPPVQPAGI